MITYENHFRELSDKDILPCVEKLHISLFKNKSKKEENFPEIIYLKCLEKIKFLCIEQYSIKID